MYCTWGAWLVHPDCGMDSRRNRETEKTMKKFYAKLTDRENGVLIDGDAIQLDDTFIYVYSSGKLSGIFDRNMILYAHLSEQKGRDESG
jgi:hypothetical protein